MSKQAQTAAAAAAAAAVAWIIWPGAVFTALVVLVLWTCAAVAVAAAYHLAKVTYIRRSSK